MGDKLKQAKTVSNFLSGDWIQVKGRNKTVVYMQSIHNKDICMVFKDGSYNIIPFKENFITQFDEENDMPEFNEDLEYKIPISDIDFIELDDHMRNYEVALNTGEPRRKYRGTKCIVIRGDYVLIR